MKKKNAFIITFILLLVSIIAIMPVYSWFVVYHTKLLVVVSDINMSVDGWYEVVAMDFPEEDLSYPYPLTDIDQLSNLFLEHYIALKFNIINKSGQDANLSVRFSDFSENIFRHFREYYAVVLDGGTVEPDSALGRSIITASVENTAKTTLALSDVYYENPLVVDEEGNPERISIMNERRFLWQYLIGQKFVENVVLPNAIAGHKTVSLYFKLTNLQSQDALTEYKKWLCDAYVNDEGVEVPGYGREKCANLLGFTWERANENAKRIIDEYLAVFYNYEISAINFTDEELSNLNLTIKYFEFIGETTPI